MIEFSKKRIARAREEKVDIRQLAIAELMAWGWSASDAMLVIGVIHESDSDIEAKHAAVNYTSTPEFDVIRKKRIKQIRNGSMTDENQKVHPTPGSASSNRGKPRADGTSSERKRWQGEEEEPASDEELLAKMWETITKLDAADPKRVDLLDKYDKLKRRTNVSTEDTTIHFYLPRPECDTCPFRGGNVITEPEKKPEPKPEPKPEIDPDTPKPGYSIHGKKLGRPPKRRRKKKADAATTENQTQK